MKYFVAWGVLATTTVCFVRQLLIARAISVTCGKGTLLALAAGLATRDNMIGLRQYMEERLYINQSPGRGIFYSNRSTSTFYLPGVTTSLLLPWAHHVFLISLGPQCTPNAPRFTVGLLAAWAHHVFIFSLNSRCTPKVVGFTRPFIYR